MDTYFKIAVKDIPTLLDIYAEGTKKKNKKSRYKRIKYEIWKILKAAESWQIRLNDNPDPCYNILKNKFMVFAIYSDPKIGEKKYEAFEFRINDDSFGSFLQDMRKEGVLQKMDSSFAELSVAEDSVGKIIDTLSTSGYGLDYEAAKRYDYCIDTSPSAYSTDCLTVSKNDVIFHGEAIGIKENKGDIKNMNNTGINFDFGTCEKDNVRMSMYGIAVKNTAGEWVSYDAKTDSVINVDIFNFNGGKYLFKMPVALKDVKKGDTIIHNKVPMFISKIEDGKIFAVDPVAGEQKCVLLTKNMFGFDFATKVVSLFDMGVAAAPSKDSPFGNMWPLLLADGNVDPMMLMMMNGNMKDMDPMMMYLLMDKSNNKDTGLLLWAMMNK